VANRGADLTTMRDAVEDFYHKNCQLGPDVEVEAAFTPVPGLWITTPAGRGRTILYLHGGGYAVCSAQAYSEVASRIARAAAARVFVLDYRRAPEHRFPAAVEDAVLAFRRILQTGVDPRTTCVMGDSAGGGLALAVLMALRDAGQPLPS